MTKNNNRVKTAERLAKLETNQDWQKDKMLSMCSKLDDIKEQMDKWRGQFGIIAALSGLVGGGIISLFITLLLR